jgi:hypothetical protein
MSTPSWNPSPKARYVLILILVLAHFYVNYSLKDETVVTLSIMGIAVQDAVNPFPYPILSLAAPRSLVIHSFCELMYTLT